MTGPGDAFELAPDGSTLHRRLELWYRKRLQEIEEDFSAEELSEAEYDAALDELHELFGRESERLTTMAILLDLPAGAAPGSAPSPGERRKERRKLTAEEGFAIWIRSPAAERLLRDFAGARAVAEKVWPEAWRARDAEVQALREALIEIRDGLEWVYMDRRAEDSFLRALRQAGRALRQVDAALAGGETGETE